MLYQDLSIAADSIICQASTIYQYLVHYVQKLEVYSRLLDDPAIYRFFVPKHPVVDLKGCEYEHIYLADAILVWLIITLDDSEMDLLRFLLMSIPICSSPLGTMTCILFSGLRTVTNK